MGGTISELAISARLGSLDWEEIRRSLWEHGYARTPAVLTREECQELIGLYGTDAHFRSHIVMSRYRFGRGDYKYFNYPLPPLVQQLREHSYPCLAPLANEWKPSPG